MCIRDSLRGKLAQVVGAAVHVGVLRFIIIPGGIQDGQGLLRGGRIVQVDVYKRQVRGCPD